MIEVRLNRPNFPDELRSYSDSDCSGKSEHHGCYIEWSCTGHDPRNSSNSELVECRGRVPRVDECNNIHIVLPKDSGMVLVSRRMDTRAETNSSERAGVGRMKHLHIKQVWLQAWVRLKIVRITKIRTEDKAGRLLD